MLRQLPAVLDEEPNAEAAQLADKLRVVLAPLASTLASTLLTNLAKAVAGWCSDHEVGFLATNPKILASSLVAQISFRLLFVS